MWALGLGFGVAGNLVHLLLAVTNRVRRQFASGAQGVLARKPTYTAGRQFFRCPAWDGERGTHRAHGGLLLLSGRTFQAEDL